MEFLAEHPELTKQFEILCQTRRDEILSHMVETDSEYEGLRCRRADTSMAMKEALDDSSVVTALFEAYSDAVYAQEAYELDSIYRQALRDAVDLLENHGFI